MIDRKVRGFINFSYNWLRQAKFCGTVCKKFTSHLNLPRSLQSLFAQFISWQRTFRLWNFENMITLHQFLWSQVVLLITKSGCFHFSCKNGLVADLWQVLHSYSCFGTVTCICSWKNGFVLVLILTDWRLCVGAYANFCTHTHVVMKRCTLILTTMGTAV